MGMNFLVLLIPIWVLSSILVSSATTTPPLPSNSDPVLPAEKDPSSQISADREAKPPGVAEVRIVHHQDLNKKILVALIVSSSLLGGVVLALTCLWVCRYRSLKKSAVNSQTKQDAAKVQSRAPTSGKFQSSKSAGRKGNVAVIDYQLLVAATNNFLESNILTEGGFGRVYKACFNDNLLGAVKRNHGGPDAELEFENEMEWLSKIHHQNIVSLLGYCIHGETRFLVYEMMQNGSLESQLHGLSHGAALTWQIRMKIALDVARGLEFLHERCNPQVIHRDLKTSNILLDSNFNAKLSDFGLAITGGNQGKDNLKLSGTLGYVAPEYLLDGKLTDKSDVYAFGVVLLELLTGRKPVEKTATSHQSLVTWAMPQLTDRSKLPKIVDPVIRDTMDLKHLYQVAAVAVLCVQPEPSYRPLITDVLHSFVPLVPPELRGSLRITEPVKAVRR